MAEIERPATPSQLHRALRAFFKAPETWRLLEAVERGYGFIDGGCWDVALALHSWLGTGELVIVAGHHKTVEHVLLRVGDRYLDADGASDKKALLRRWRELELVREPRVVPFDETAVRGAGVPHSPELANNLAALLERRIDPAAARPALGLA